MPSLEDGAIRSPIEYLVTGNQTVNWRGGKPREQVLKAMNGQQMKGNQSSEI